MKRRNISKEIQTKVKRYLEYTHTEQENDEDLTLFLDCLPKKFQADVISDMYFHIFSEINLLKNFSDDFLKQLAFKIKEISYTPGDIIQV